MADVTGRRERAQLILVSGLIVAVTLLVLVLLLNTVIYTENVSTRGVGGESGEALTFQSAVEVEVERIVLAEQAALVNEGDYEWDELETAVADSTDEFEAFQDARGIQYGRLSVAEVDRLIPGVHVDTDELADLDGPLATEIDDVDAFQLTIDGFEEGDEFEIHDGSEWSVFVTGNADDAVILRDEDGPICDGTMFEGVVSINVLDGSVEGSDGGSASCPEDLWDHEDAPEEGFDLAVSHVEGTWGGALELVSGGEDIEVGESVPGDVYAPFVYETRIQLEFVSSDLEYRTVVTIGGTPP